MLMDPYPENIKRPSISTNHRKDAGQVNTADCWRLLVNNNKSDTIDVCLPSNKEPPVIVSALPIIIKKTTMKIPEK